MSIQWSTLWKETRNKQVSITGFLETWYLQDKKYFVFKNFLFRSNYSEEVEGKTIRITIVLCIKENHNIDFLILIFNILLMKSHSNSGQLFIGGFQILLK